MAVDVRAPFGNDVRPCTGTHGGPDGFSLFRKHFFLKKTKNFSTRCADCKRTKYMYTQGAVRPKDWPVRENKKKTNIEFNTVLNYGNGTDTGNSGKTNYCNTYKLY